ncbi:MAG: RNA polymerase sigma factor [Aeromicrobium sp.]
MTSWVGDGASSEAAAALARECYAEHGGEMYGFARGRLSDDSSAQDAVQETIIRVWRAAHRFDPERGTLRTWSFAILRNVITDHANVRQRMVALNQSIVERREDPVSDQSGAVADADLITRAMGHLSDDHRTAIVETYLRDRAYDEVAAELGVSVSTLRSRVFYGLKQLRHTMKTMVVEP